MHLRIQLLDTTATLLRGLKGVDNSGAFIVYNNCVNMLTGPFFQLSEKNLIRISLRSYRNSGHASSNMQQTIFIQFPSLPLPP